MSEGPAQGTGSVVRSGLVVAVVGPTAVGKSEVADRVARALGTGVVSADAMQVYRGMDVGTAKVPEAERRAPLLMVDVADITDAYSVALYQRQAREAIDGLLEDAGTCVVCGGSGLYVRAALDAMDIPEGSMGHASRTRWEARAEELGAQGLWEELDRRDPASAALIHPHNVRRVVRALEMLDQGGSYAERGGSMAKLSPLYESRIWGLTKDREALYGAIDARVDAMFAQGLVEEVRHLMGEGLAESPTASQAIGYKEVMAALEGRLTMAQAADEVKRRSRHLAKRQLTWFRRDGRVRWLSTDEHTVGEIVALIADDARTRLAAAGRGRP